MADQPPQARLLLRSETTVGEREKEITLRNLGKRAQTADGRWAIVEGVEDAEPENGEPRYYVLVRLIPTAGDN